MTEHATGQKIQEYPPIDEVTAGTLFEGFTNGYRQVTAAQIRDFMKILPDLPTADPVIADALWNDGGTLKISTGPYLGPLNFTTGTVVAAYGQRALSTAMLGAPIYTIREDGGDTTQSFSSDAVTGLLDVSAITTFLNGANGFVTKWNDQSGNSRDGIQATALQQPAWIATASPLTRPGVGRTDNAAGPSLVTAENVPLTGSFSVFAVVIPTTPGTDLNHGPLFAASYHTGGSTAYAIANFATSGNAILDMFNSAQVQAEIGGYGTITIDPDTAYLVDMHAILGANAMFVNGVDQSAGNNNDWTNAPSISLPIGLFCLDDFNTTTRGYGLELIIVSPAITDSAERLAIRQNMATFYGITL